MKHTLGKHDDALHGYWLNDRRVLITSLQHRESQLLLV